MSGISENDSAATTLASEPDAAQPVRSDWIRELANAPGGRLDELWEGLSASPRFEVVRGPEIGLVMVRGSAGGAGAAFNLGEATATRCSIRLETGEEGHALALGRDKRKATIAALCDALMQTRHRPRIISEIIRPLSLERTRKAHAEAEKAAATRVEFFTMVRGDDS